MSVYIEIVGTNPCGNCGAPLSGWQSKNLAYDGYAIALLLQTVKLNKKMRGEIHNSHAACEYFTEYVIERGAIMGQRERHALVSPPTDPPD
jgi:hypothetical protein